MIKETKKINEKAFLIFLYLNVFCKGIGLGNDSKIYLLLLFLSIFFIVFKIINEKYTKNEFLICGLMFIIGLVSFLVTHKPTLFLTIICLIGMKNVNIDKIFKGMFNIRFVGFILIISLSLIGIIPNNSISMWRNGKLDVRYALGFGHPNSLHLALFILISLYLYIKNKNIKLINYIFLIIINQFIYHYSLSRTGYLLTFLLIITFMVIKYIKVNKRIINIFTKLLLIFLIAFSFISGLMYSPNNDVMNKLNKIFNGRIAFSNYYLKNYDATLFGNRTILQDNKALFDNGYLFLYLQYGIIGMIFIIGLIYEIIKSKEIKNDCKKNVLVLFYLVYLFVESFSPNIFMNIILLFGSYVIFENQDIKRKDRDGEKNFEKLYL